MAMPFLKRKSGQALLIAASGIAVVYSFQSWRHLSAMTQTRGIDRELKVAVDASQSQPTSVARFEDLLARIKRIETERAPEEVKNALASYVEALEAAIAAIHAREDLAPHDHELEKAQKRLAAAVAKHWY